MGHNIKMELGEIEWDSMDSINLEHVAGSCEHHNEPPISIKYGQFLD
jgi:hypothetical protein